MRVGFEHRFESLAGVATLVADFGEMCEMATDLTLMPGEQDCPAAPHRGVDQAGPSLRNTTMMFSSVHSTWSGSAKCFLMVVSNSTSARSNSVAEYSENVE